MRKAQTFLLTLLTLLTISAPRISSAALQPCKLYTNDSLFPDRSTVDLWILNSSVSGLITPMTATGLSSGDVKLALQRAAEIWNEESGSSLQLRVRGFTNSTSITDAIVVTGQQTTCNSALAVAYVNASGSSASHRFVDGSIELRRFQSGNCGAPVNWCTTVNGTCIDVVPVLLHEIGHAAYNLNHPNSGAPDCSNVSGGSASVMWSSYSSTRNRTLKQWDLELAQARYTPRSNSSVFFKTQLSGTSTWIGAGPAANQFGRRPLIRPGSMPSNVDKRYFGWVRGGTSANDGGTGFIDTAHYSTGNWHNIVQYGGWASQKGLTRPVAAAGYVSGSATPMILVYQKYITPQPVLYSSTTDQGVICYRRSSNGIANLGAENCSSVTTTYFGLTAAFDSVTQHYLIGYIANDSMQMGVLAVPSLTNTISSGSNTVLSASSYHAPSIACDGTGFASLSTGCKLFYEEATNNGYLSWLNLNVSAFGGGVTVASSYSTTLITMDTPSAAYWASDGSFRIAYTIDNNAAYTYKVIGNVITGTGDAFNDVNAFISSPIVNPRIGSMSKLYTWFVKPW